MMVRPEERFLAVNALVVAQANVARNWNACRHGRDGRGDVERTIAVDRQTGVSGKNKPCIEASREMTSHLRSANVPPDVLPDLLGREPERS